MVITDARIHTFTGPPDTRDRASLPRGTHRTRFGAGGPHLPRPLRPDAHAGPDQSDGTRGAAWGARPTELAGHSPRARRAPGVARRRHAGLGVGHLRGAG